MDWFNAKIKIKGTSTDCFAESKNTLTSFAIPKIAKVKVGDTIVLDDSSNTPPLNHSGNSLEVTKVEDCVESFSGYNHVTAK